MPVSLILFIMTYIRGSSVVVGALLGHVPVNGVFLPPLSGFGGLVNKVTPISHNPNKGLASQCFKRIMNVCFCFGSCF